ncbi:MAG TPA: NADH-quinone oxidoreductase subunit N [Halobacteriales archaeon]|nr:NADH-quinone oxidoreductase subunit N [Halobacteriales archaeon]
MALFELHPLTPTLLIGLAALAVLAYDSVYPESDNRTVLAGITVLGALASLATAVFFLSAGAGLDAAFSLLDDALVVDGMSLFLTVVVAAVTAMVAIASYDYLEGHRYQGEYYGLLLLAASGMSLMASANSLATAFVALELASLPSYALVAFLKDDQGSVEAGLKYFLIGALSSAVFAFGISLVYGATGSLQLGAVASAVANPGGAVGILGIGVLMVLGGFAFKTASVPFHFWAPEAYEGAVAPISAFVSSASKAAGFFLAFRVLVEAFPIQALLLSGIDWVLAVQILAVVTMTLGNFAAATQENVKRMLAYSSVGHAGYALIGLAALTGGQDALVMGAAMTHLLVYGFMNTGAFLFVALVEHWGVGRTFEDYNGLGRQAPVASVAMTVFMFSLAGLPIGGGFLSKYFLFLGAVGAGFWWLAAVGAVNSALSLFYYSRVVKALWIEEPEAGRTVGDYPVGIYVAIVTAAVVTVALLPFFTPVLETAIEAASLLFA